MRVLCATIVAAFVTLIAWWAWGQGIYICQGANCPPSLNGITLSGAGTFTSGASSGTIIGNLLVATSGPPFSGSFGALGGPNAANFQIVNGNQLATNGVVAATGSQQSYNILATANQAGSVNSSVTSPVIVTALQVPVGITYNPASPVSVLDNITPATTISAVTVPTSDGHAFFGSLSLTANAGGRVALSGNNIVPAHNFTQTDDGSNLIVAVQPSENGVSVSANLTMTVSPAGGAACPMGTAYPDGCSGAQATGQIQYSTLFTGLEGTVYPIRPPWNVAGVDYPIGYTGTPADGTVPANLTAASTPPGCATLSGSTFTISATTQNCTVNGIDFKGNCVSVPTSTGFTATITNSSFYTSANCNPNGGYPTGVTGSGSAVFKYDEFNDAMYGTDVSSTGISALVKASGTANLTIEYSWFPLTNQADIEYDNTSPGATTLMFNYSEVLGKAPHHGDWPISNFSGAGVQQTITANFNTNWSHIVNGNVGNATSFIYCTNWDGSTAQVSCVADNNSVILDAGTGVGVEANPGGIINGLETKNNYFDTRGATVGPFSMPTQAGSQFTVPAVCSGNKNLVTGAAVTGTISSFGAGWVCS